MTLGSPAPVKGDRRERKQKHVADEKTPLLPKHREEDVGHDGFNGASFPGAVFNLTTTIVGAGIMALPATMKVMGLVPGIAMIIFMAFLTEASIEMLLRFSRAGKTASYGAVMGEAFGRIGRMLLQICVVINNVGVLIVYMIIIGMKFSTRPFKKKIFFHLFQFSLRLIGSPHSYHHPSYFILS